MSERQPSEEELRQALDEQLKRITVTDVLIQTVVTLVNLAGRRLGLSGDEGERDLDQARLGIEATRALVPLLPEEQTAPIRDALSQLQMAYAREARKGGEQPDETARREAAAPPQSSEQTERARARSKIWTPPGS